VKGGYAFAREPGEITVLEVVELLDGRLGAEAEGIFAEAAAAARAVLAKTTIADVVDRENQAAGATMYYI
jgi:DNA-binding IscR family transcriptional regulator